MANWQVFGNCSSIRSPGTDAEVGQPGGDPIGHRVQFGEGVAAVGVDDGGALRPVSRPVAQDRIQRTAGPIPGLAVLIGTIGREWNETVEKARYPPPYMACWAVC